MGFLEEHKKHNQKISDILKGKKKLLEAMKEGLLYRTGKKVISDTGYLIERLKKR